MLRAGSHGPEPMGPAAGRALERDVRGHDDFDFRAGARRAQQPQRRADALRALAHADDAEVARPSGFDDRRIDAAAVVADVDPQAIGTVIDLDVDARRARVTE